ncbi:DsbA family protein [Asticcacaulis taihuensis]|jgi:protein-disulfide isomerase|uniref:DsbA family protein n=1 Tax=Asticcacaulis taihuensis TaxID=260084 RepID=UPI0026F039FE|nr:thioredoxin domain-containing protein [Asticcacaulis taihuensis]
MQISVGKTLRVSGAVAFMGLALLASGCSKGGSAGAVGADEMSMGPADAKVTVIEYASVACPICGHVNETVMPEFKAKYIDSGKVRYVYRPMMTGNPAVAAAGHMLAECAGKDKYFTVIDQVMRSQEAMGGEETGYANARPVLFSIGQSLGMSEDAFNKCITDEKGLKRLNDLNQQYMTKDGVNGTPTFVINGKKLDRIPLNIGDFDAALKPALSK